MTEFEIRQLIFDIEAVIADQFQFWMAATFAVVVVSYTAGERLKVWARVCVAALYFAAVTTFFLRYLMATDQTREAIGMLTAMGADLGVSNGLPTLVSYLRRIVIVAGTVFATVSILRPTMAHRPHRLADV